jgi:cytidylate kinase
MTEPAMKAEPAAELNSRASAESASIPTTRRPIIAIDGPAGAGKSTVARHLARYFGLLNLESGAMYRAFALKALAAGVSLEDVPALVELSRATSILLESGEEGNRVLLDGRDVTAELREPAVTDGASRVSVHPQIRAWMVALQQQLGAAGGVVMEGRDIGTVVFPHADVKIFLDAAPEVRGLRRYDQLDQLGQLGQQGPAPEIQPEEVVRELRARDERDRNRADSPLKAAEDAVLLNSTNLTLEEVVTQAEAIVEEKLHLNN